MIPRHEVSEQCKLFGSFQSWESLSQFLFSRSPSCFVVGCWRLSLFVVAVVAAVAEPAGPH